jgi:hypothetical protein
VTVGENGWQGTVILAGSGAQEVEGRVPRVGKAGNGGLKELDFVRLMRACSPWKQVCGVVVWRI